MREIVDFRGRNVLLTAAAWQHILGRHVELEPHLEDIVEAVRAPTHHAPGRAANEEWFFLAGAGPSRWLQVVVHFVGERGSVTTAFGRRVIP